MRSKEHLKMRNQNIYAEYLRIKRDNHKSDVEIFDQLSGIPFKIKNQEQCLSAETLRGIVGKIKKVSKVQQVS